VSAPRLFVAVWPPPEVTDAVDALPRQQTPDVAWEPPGLAHVTLRFLGSCDPDDACAALAGLHAPPAQAQLGPAVTLLGDSVVVVPVAGLDSLAAAVLACTADIGQPPTHRPFVGHLTVARLRRHATCPLVGQPLSASFGVHDVALVRSEPPAAGHPRRYTTVATFTLDGDTAGDTDGDVDGNVPGHHA
jgi:RNA 2',3'-cyclic 3'-phosphodiesterase